jgi:beta-mannanase
MQENRNKGFDKNFGFNELGSEEPDWCCNYSGKIEYIKPIKYFIRSQISVESQKN